MSGSRFKKGVSGNPGGRPKADIANLKPLLAKHGEAVLQKVVDHALSGDIAACKLILDRLYPAIKPHSGTVALSPKGTHVEQGETVIKATLKGDIPADTGQSIMTSLSSQVRLIDHAEFEKRLEALEKKK